MRAFMTNCVGKKNEIEWQDFVVSNFDHFKDEEMNSSGSLSQNKFDAPANRTTEEESVVVDEDVYRTCTVSLNKVIRKDIDPSIEILIKEKLQYSIVTSTNYKLFFSSLLQMMMIHLISIQFFVDGTALYTRKVSGFDMTTIIPSEFQMGLLPKHTITPIAADINQSPALVADFNQLFQEQHLNLIHSRYFGLRGAVEKIWMLTPYKMPYLNQWTMMISKRKLSLSMNYPQV